VHHSAHSFDLLSLLRCDCHVFACHALYVADIKMLACAL
jgi:hypothetical protein